MKKNIIFLIAALSFLALLPQQAQAASEDVWSMAQSDSYGKKAGGMFGRGLVNVATSFVDVIVHTVEGTKEGVPFVGTLTGLGSGIACTALRVSSGALDVATFWVPGFNGIPVSRSYSNCLEMEESPAEDTVPTPAYDAPEPKAVAPSGDTSPSRDPMDYVKK